MSASRESAVRALQGLLRSPSRAVVPPVAAEPEALAAAFDLASRFGLGAFVAGRLLSRPLPAELRARVTEELWAGKVVTAAARRRVAELFTAFARAGVAAISLKGPAFSKLAYEVPPPRVLGDVDIYVPPGQLKRALRVLSAAGFGSEVDLDAVRALGGVELLHENSVVAVDLHTRLAKQYYVPHARAPSRDDLVAVEIEGAMVPTLGPRWAIAFAAVQLHQDLFALRRVVDLAAILASSPTGAVMPALAIARSFGCGGVLKLGARLAVELGAPLPAVLARPPATAFQRALARRLSLATLSDRPVWLAFESWSYDVQLAARWLLLDDPLDAFTMASRRLLAPPPALLALDGGQRARLARVARGLLNRFRAAKTEGGVGLGFSEVWRAFHAERAE
jgi:hypothetical protein